MRKTFLLDDYPLVIKEHTAWDLVGAEDRIDALRKGDFSVIVHLESGESVPFGTEYSLKQIKHSFYLEDLWQPIGVCLKKIGILNLKIIFQGYLIMLRSIFIGQATRRSEENGIMNQHLYPMRFFAGQKIKVWSLKGTL